MRLILKSYGGIILNIVLWEASFENTYLKVRQTIFFLTCFLKKVAKLILENNMARNIEFIFQ